MADLRIGNLQGGIGGPRDIGSVELPLVGQRRLAGSVCLQSDGLAQGQQLIVWRASDDGRAHWRKRGQVGPILVVHGGEDASRVNRMAWRRQAIRSEERR